MAYQTPITIKDAIENIRKRHYVLPSIQREFVWGPEQIEQLFDSLMRDYPISTFLFWRVEKQRIKDFQFYEFLREYHEKHSRHNPKADLPQNEDVIAILDGQQRLTSLYLALCGSHAEKLPYRRRDKLESYPKRKLYLNLLAPSPDVEMEYDFKFLTEEDAKPKPGFYWFEVSKILEITEMKGIMKYMAQHRLMDTSQYTAAQGDFASEALSQLWNVIHQAGTLSYYEEKGEALDKVLQIFIRINSGGTKLSYSDLLLSIATAQWEKADAREEINGLVDDLNNIGDGFNFNKDFVLKACLVLGDFSDVNFKVDNFTRANMLRIEALWEKIAAALRLAVELAAGFGFSRETLTSTNALIPIAYYLYKNQRGRQYLESSQWSGDRKAIKEWLIRNLLKRIFGSASDTFLMQLRAVISETQGHFPLAEIMEKFKGSQRTLAFSDDDLDNLLCLEYGNALTYSALSLIYPALKGSTRYHQDHIHPKSYFTPHKLGKEGVTDPEQQRRYTELVNQLPNLQLLPAIQNTEKSGKHFQSWLEDRYPEPIERQSFLQQHLIPIQTPLGFHDFEVFHEARKVSLKARFAEVLGLAKESHVAAEVPA